MIGSHTIGTQWLGSGRSQGLDYVEVAGQLEATASMVLDISPARLREVSGELQAIADLSGAIQRSRPMSGALEATTGFDGLIARRRGLSAELEATTSLDPAINRRRGLSGTLEATASLAGGTNARRGMSATLRVHPSLSGQPARRRSLQALVTGLRVTATLEGNEPGRQRGMSAKLHAFDTPEQPVDQLPRPFTSLRGAVGRYRFLSATLQWAASLSASAASGKLLSGSVAATFEILFGRIRTFFSASQAGRFIYVQPKDRGLIVPEKDRVIIFAGDDEALSMEERIKQPSEVVDYTIDMREWFASIPDDFIPFDDASAVTLTVDIQGDPDDLVIGPGVQPDWVPVGDPPHMAKVWIGGGRDGVEYKVTAVIRTNAGRVEEVDFIVIVEEQ